MKLNISKVGNLQYAELSLSDFTIICGKNNTGKTYATHATYALFDFLRSSSQFPFDESTLEILFTEGSFTLLLDDYMMLLDDFFTTACCEYSQSLYKVFVGNQDYFKDAYITCNADIRKH